MAFPYVPWKLRVQIRNALRRTDPLKAVKGESPPDRYEDVALEIAQRLLRGGGDKPTVERAAWIIWGTLTDVYGGLPAFDKEPYRGAAERIAKVWDDCFIIGG